VIPRRWLPFVKEAALWGAHTTRDRAQALIDADRASSRRKSARTLPGRKAKKATKAERTARVGAIRDALLARSGGRCEACGEQGSDLHHILSGRGTRRSQEVLETVVYLCRDCHRGLENHPDDFAEALSQRPVWEFLSLPARAAIIRRAEKVTTLEAGRLPR
jgi:hypothetical protein